MKKIRIGNDFTFTWAIYRDGLPEDLLTVNNKIILLNRQNKSVILSEDFYNIQENIITLDFTSELLTEIGLYNLELQYTVDDESLIDGVRNCAVDIDAFIIVSTTREASESNDFYISSDLAIAFKGIKGDVGPSIISAQFDNNNIIFGKDDGNVVTLYNAKQQLKGDPFLYENFTQQQLDNLKGSDGNSITNVNFIQDDMVFTLSDDSTISLLNARISLKGERGITPYEFAIQNGFVGTSEEWLASLKGEPGYTPIKGVDYFDGINATTTEVATQTTDGLMSALDKLKIDGIEEGAQVNTVFSVNSKTGDVVLSYSDVDAASSIHEHIIADVTNLQTTLDNKSDINHTHTQYLTSFVESDPTVPSYVKNITENNISNWIDAYTHSQSEHQTIIDGTGFVKVNGKTLTYDNSSYSLSSHNHDSIYEPANANIQLHISSTSNPHGVTKSDVGLGNVLNVPSYNKTESDAALSLKLNKSIFDDLFEKVEVSTGVYAIEAKYDFYSIGGVSAYGLGTGDSGGGIDLLQTWADYTQDKDNWAVKAGLLVPFYNTTQSRLTTLEGGSVLTLSVTGNGNGISSITKTDNNLSVTKGNFAELDTNGKIISTQLPSYVDDVLEFPSLANFPATGESGKIYISVDTNLTYRWSGTVYVIISSSLALGETAQTAYRGDRGKMAYDHSQTAHQAILNGTGFVKVSGTTLSYDSSSYSLSDHNHSGVYEPIFSKNSAFNKNFGTTIGTVTQGNDSRLSDARTPLAHVHAISDITGLTASLTAKLDKAIFEDLFEKINVGTELDPNWIIKAKYSLYSIGEISAYGFIDDLELTGSLYSLSDVQLTNNISGQILVYNGTHWVNANMPESINSWNDLIDKPTTFTPTSHTHSITDVTNLQTTLDDKVDNSRVLTDVPLNAEFTDTIYVHPTSHPISMIEGLTDTLNGKVDNSRVLTDVPANALFTDTIYNHPSSHPASMITQSSSYRFVTDTEKYTWNNKSDLILGSTSTTAYRGDRGVTAYNHSQSSGNPHGTTFTELGGKPDTLSGYGITDGVTIDTAQTITGAKTFSANLTASVSVTTPKVIFAAAGWSLEQSGTELQMKYNGTAKMRFLSGGSIVATQEITAYA